MTEVDYGEEGHRTRLGEINDQLVCLEVPLPPYIKEQGGGQPALEGAPGGGILLLVGVGFLPFLLLLGGGKEGEEREGKAPPLLVQLGQRGGGALPALGRPLSLSLMAQQGPLAPGGFW